MTQEQVKTLWNRVTDKTDTKQDKVRAKGTNYMGYKTLSPSSTFASQVTATDTIYVIQTDFDLGNTSVRIPSGSVLQFEGGSINNGTLTSSTSTIKYIGQIQGNVVFSSTPLKLVTPANVSGKIYYAILEGNMKEGKDVNISNDTLVYDIGRNALIQNFTINNTNYTSQPDAEGVAFSATSSADDAYRHLAISRFKKGIEITGGGYSLIDDVRFNYNKYGIYIDAEAWVGEIRVNNSHINYNQYAIYCNTNVSQLSIVNCVFEGNSNDLVLGGDVELKNCYFGDHDKYTGTAENNALITVLPGSTIKIYNCRINGSATSSYTGCVFKLLGTSENPCHVEIYDSTLLLVNNANNENFVFCESTCEDNTILMKRVSLIKDKPSHSFLFPWLNGNSYTILPNNDAYNYITDGYFEDDVQNTLLAANSNVSILNGCNIYGGKLLRFTRYLLTFVYDIPVEFIGKPMCLDVALYGSYMATGKYVNYSGCADLEPTEDPSEQRARFYGQPTVMSFIVTPTCKVGRIGLYINNEDNNDPGYVDVGYARLVPAEYMNMADKFPTKPDLIYGDQQIVNGINTDYKRDVFSLVSGAPPVLVRSEYFTASQPSDKVVGTTYFDTTLNMYVYWDGTKWVHLQEELVGSGTGQNVKTVNNNTLVGSGNIAIDSGIALSSNISVDGTVESTVQDALSAINALAASNKTALSGKSDMTASTSIIPNGGLLPNVFYHFGVTDSPTITLNTTGIDPTIANEWQFSLIAKTSSCSVTLPSDVILANGYSWSMAADRCFCVNIKRIPASVIDSDYATPNVYIATVDYIDITPVMNYLTIESLGSGNVTITIPAEIGSSYMSSISYSKDRVNWITTAIDSTEQTITIPVVANDLVFIKGSGNRTSDGSGHSTNITCSANYNLSGNIMSLFYGDEFIGKTAFKTSDYHSCRALFKNSITLQQAHDLVLPVVNLNRYSYTEMFQGCTSLVTSPKLPATTLDRYCYYSMFQDCTSLTAAPELPATTLTMGCYYQMFQRCASLTTSPELPATTLTTGCYYRMFYECTRLNSITMLATDISATNCLSTWVGRVASTGTFVKAASMTSLPSGASGIPSGWTVEDES